MNHLIQEDQRRLVYSQRQYKFTIKITYMDRLLTLLLCLLLAIPAYSQKTIEWQNIEVVTDSYQHAVYYQKGKEKPLDGSFRFKKGMDEEIVNLEKGIMNGKYRRLRDGIVREEGNYMDGRRNGLFVEYYQDGTTHRKDTPMKNGKIDGTVITYFSDGKKESEKTYRESLEHGVERRYSQSSGETLIEGQWVNGKKEGTWKEIFDAGRGITGVRLQHYRNGELDGPYSVEMSKEGKPYVTIRGQFSEGKKTGKWSQYDAELGNTREWNEK